MKINKQATDGNNVFRKNFLPFVSMRLDEYKITSHIENSNFTFIYIHTYSHDCKPNAININFNNV